MDKSFTFEPFAKFDPGKPFKLIPQGLWHRGERVLPFTKDVLQKVEQNFKNGLPQFRVPINIEHKDGNGKIGDVKDVRYMEDGPSGSGLYVTEYELTEKGKRLIDEDGYDGVSAEIAWEFQDIETGEEHEDVLVGMAITTKPYFGHKHASLFSADDGLSAVVMGDDKKQTIAFGYVEDSMEELPFGGATTWDEYEAWMAQREQAEDVEKTLAAFSTMSRTLLSGLPDMSLSQRLKGVISLATSLVKKMDDGGEDQLSDNTQSEEFKDYSPEKRRELADKGFALPDGSFPIVDRADLANAIQAYGRAKNQAVARRHIIKRAKALGATDMLPEDFEADIPAEEEIVENEKEVMSAEELTALQERLSASEGEKEELSAENETLKAKIEEMKAKEREKELRAEAESFEALAIPVDEYTAKMGALSEKDQELYAWVVEKFQAADKAIEKSGALEELGTDKENDEDKIAKFEALIDAKVKEGADYAEATSAVSKEHPILAAEYHARGAGGK